MEEKEESMKDLDDDERNIMTKIQKRTGKIPYSPSWITEGDFGMCIMGGHVIRLELYASDLKIRYSVDAQLIDLIAQLSYLKVLNLDQNVFSPSLRIPDSIGNLKNLESLHLRHAKFPYFPTNIGNLPKLKKLFLDSNNLKELPSSLENLQSLQFLSLDCNDFAHFPEVITKLKALRSLRFQSQHTDFIPMSVCNLTSLEFFAIYDTIIDNLEESLPILEKLKQQKCTIFANMFPGFSLYNSDHNPRYLRKV